MLRSDIGGAGLLLIILRCKVHEDHAIAGGRRAAAAPVGIMALVMAAPSGRGNGYASVLGTSRL